ncbi:hypothetical protein GF407_14375 [candidate division KSB1 bacterium]|nr:hypothetical protein [candidate division KSB1 bacterium]
MFRLFLLILILSITNIPALMAQLVIKNTSGTNLMTVSNLFQLERNRR